MGRTWWGVLGGCGGWAGLATGAGGAGGAGGVRGQIALVLCNRKKSPLNPQSAPNTQPAALPPVCWRFWRFNNGRGARPVGACGWGAGGGVGYGLGAGWVPAGCRPGKPPGSQAALTGSSHRARMGAWVRMGARVRVRVRARGRAQARRRVRVCVRVRVCAGAPARVCVKKLWVGPGFFSQPASGSTQFFHLFNPQEFLVNPGFVHIQLPARLQKIDT
jgi:hypothetical protein